MKKCYLLLFFVPFIFSCSSRLSYVGSTYKPTKQVDVFVAESAVKNAYDIVGKGYINMTVFTSVEKMQAKAVEKAKQKGADAVLIADYYVPNTGASINTTMRTDSVGKGTVSVGNSTVQQTGTSGFNVWFLKYR